MMDLFLIKREMMSLLETVGAAQQPYSFNQVMQYVKKYVQAHNLTSPIDQFLITVDDDPLGCLLSSSSFNLKNTDQRKNLILRIREHLEPIKPVTVVPGAVAETMRSEGGVKRKISCTDFDEPKSPMFLYLPPSPIYDSGEETVFSIQEYSTEEACNSGSESYTDDSEDSRDFLSNKYNSICSEMASFVPKVIQEALMFPERHEGDIGSDVPFWADHSDDEGFARSSSCDKSLQIGVVPRFQSQSSQQSTSSTNSSNSKRRKMRLSKKQRRTKQQSQDMAKSSQESFSPEEMTEALEKCIICCNRDANALILHGRTAHNVCCYQCARKLQKQPNMCPACRRQINRVVLLL